jgi:tRNA(Ile)-lysidine synthase
VRPLLNITRAEIEAYCREHDLQPRHDHTNEDIRLLRNRLRLETVPHLREMNPQIEQALNRFAAIAARDQDFMVQQLQQTIRDSVEVTPQRVTLPRAIFSDLHLALQHHFVWWAANQIGGKDVGSEHVTQTVDLALHGHTGQRVFLPNKLRMRLDYKTVIIEQVGAVQDFDGPLLPRDTTLSVTIPSVTALPESDWHLQISLTPLGESQAQLAIHEGQIVELRTRRRGDRFAPPGLKGNTQKLKQWLIDHKIPQAVRYQIPILVVDGEIAALIIGQRWVISDSFAIHDTNQSIIYVQFT